MRVVQHQQMIIGEVDVSKIRFNPKSRDDIPKILSGLQAIYSNVELRNAIFELLLKHIAPTVAKNNGRPGMTLWSILVCGVLRLDLNEDYDRLHELVNHHDTIRAMLGIGAFEDVQFHLQTLKDNVGLLTPELLDKINQLVVHFGHTLVKKKDVELVLRGRCDSFVVETNVHYPTDINLLLDAMRKIITLSAQWCAMHGDSSWRQYDYNLRQIKRCMRSVQNKKRSRSGNALQQEKNAELIKKAHQEYLDNAQLYLTKARHTIASMEQAGHSAEGDLKKKKEIEEFILHAERQIDQIIRRVMLGEIIAHGEKVFSIFEPHTEWICKGKAGVPVELGVKVCILEDQYQFILHHQVMQNQTDDQVTVEMVVQAKKRFAELAQCSFDKGFHSPANQAALPSHLALVILPKKGKLSQERQTIESKPEFIKARKAHSAVESAINALEVHGLDICPDRGIDGFKRYVALAVLARNIHRIGAILWQQEQERVSKQHRMKDNRQRMLLAA